MTDEEAKEWGNLKNDHKYIIDMVFGTPATEKDQTALYKKIINEIKHGCYPNKSR